MPRVAWRLALMPSFACSSMAGRSRALSPRPRTACAPLISMSTLSATCAERRATSALPGEEYSDTGRHVHQIGSASSVRGATAAHAESEGLVYTAFMRSTQRTPGQRKHFRTAGGMLVAAALGLLTAFVSGLGLLPRVRLVEVVTIVARGVAAGAALAAALAEFKQARTTTPKRQT